MLVYHASNKNNAGQVGACTKGESHNRELVRKAMGHIRSVHIASVKHLQGLALLDDTSCSLPSGLAFANTCTSYSHPNDRLVLKADFNETCTDVGTFEWYSNSIAVINHIIYNHPSLELPDHDLNLPCQFTAA